MDRIKLTDSKIFQISEEFASLLNDYCFEDDSYKNWELKEFRAFVDKHYDDFVLTAIDEGIIEQPEKKYFKSYDDEIHDRIKKVAIAELKILLRER